MGNPDAIAKGKVVGLRYTLRNSSGTVLDQCIDEAPMEYLHGAGNIVPGLERALEGRLLGDKLSVHVPAVDGYGERQSKGPQAVPRSAFPDDAPIEPGMQFVAEEPDGRQVVLWVTKVDPMTVHVDLDHPLAGVDLEFEVEIATLRDATSSEIAHGHPHGGEHDHHH
jgi:FKBP-type peptidyl-prolyl cis-trans isomerase SlyD